MTNENPFTPTFGEVPSHLAGRRMLLERTSKAFTSTSRRPELTTIFSGARGTGKTTLLSLLAQRATQSGWLAVSVTAMPGMLEDIEIQAKRAAAHLVDPSGEIKVRSFGVPQLLEVELASQDSASSNWRSRMEDLTEALNAKGTGLLITVDEVDVTLDEMVQLAAVYQHFVREGRKVALLMAGLPSHVSALINNKTVSFLRRAETIKLGRIEDYEVEDALRKTIEESGRHAEEEDLKHASKAVDGFPFLLQLIGFRAWDEHPDNNLISGADFEKGIQLAREDMRTRILEATFQELSDSDIAFLMAMLEDEQDSRIADLAERLQWSSSQISQYRRRLLEAGVIGERRRGVVGFDMPYFREFLLSL